jgi:hypothetical protein
MTVLIEISEPLIFIVVKTQIKKNSIGDHQYKLELIQIMFFFKYVKKD